MALSAHRDHQFVGHRVIRTQLSTQSLHSCRIPTCVNDTYPVDLQPQRNGFKPSQKFFVLRRILSHCFEKFLMLLTVISTGFSPVCSQEIMFSIRMSSCIRNGVELMVAHHNVSMSSFDHALGNHHRINLSRSSVNQVANENHLAFGVLPSSVRELVVHLAQEAFEFVSVSMNITDDVVSDFLTTHHYSSQFLTKCNRPQVSRFAFGAISMSASPNWSGIEEL